MATENSVVKTLISNMNNYRFNPSAIQREVLKLIPSISNGELDVVDPTNPFVFSLETAACSTAAFMEQLAAESRRRYPLLAQTQEDLYLHMSDKDYANRFAIPAVANFVLRFPKEQLLAAMKLEPATGYLKLTIPRNTFFQVAGYTFSLQYPIDIRQLAHGGLQVSYNNDVESPLQQLETNAIDYFIDTSITGDFVRFTVPATQFSIKQQIMSITKAGTTSTTITFEDQFYYARVYYQNTVTGKWVEMTTTHAESVYDIADPTAVLRVDGQTVNITIPQVYVNTGLLNSKIRVDVYQSKGAVNIQMADYPMNSFSATWKSFDSNDLKNTYSAGLPNISVSAYSDDTVISGKNAMPVSQLRDNVIMNTTGPIDDSISPAQIKTKLVNKGYDIVTHIDNITDRVFLATRSMPNPSVKVQTTGSTVSDQLLTAAAASIETLTLSMESLAQLPSVVDNGTSITITPDTIYQIIDGITQPVTASEMARLKGLTPDKLALEVTDGSYLYTPYHYVLDSGNKAFETRPYYLDGPVADSKLFVRQNDTTLINVATGTYGIVRTETGYLVQIVTSSDDAYKDIADNQAFVQLAYIPVGERDRAYVNGVLVGKTSSGERIYNFDLSTTYNVDSDDNIELTKFMMYNTDARVTKSPLSNQFDILYSTSQQMTPYFVASDIDGVLGRHLLPQGISGISWEKLRVKFGDSLAMLWTRARTITSSIQYQSWQVDVPNLYKADVYLRDENGSAITIVDGAPVMQILHKKGDPILDVNGSPTFEHRKGDIMLDSQGNPVPANPRGLTRQFDLLLIEGVYWFATDSTTANYRKALTKALVSWLVDDLGGFKGTLLDQTRIYFYPKTTSGVVSVYVGENVQRSILAGQSFTVTLTVPKQVYSNPVLRARLEQSTVTTLIESVKKKTVSNSDQLDDLKKTYGDDVLSIQLNGLGDAQYPIVSMVNDTDRLSIRKRLTALADGTLIAEDDVTVLWVQHEPDGE